MLTDVWVVFKGGDDRSRGEPGYFYTKHQDALTKAEGTGPYGGNAYVEQRQAVEVNGKIYLIDKIGQIDVDGKVAEEKERLRAKAKAKLTDAELAALLESKP